ncbi:hypothetical protein AKJ09_08195 [Labilithrix luteola]|uniref:Uncharacterized protein n=1 Tax=Labilithrix luteola TaxID=1391654 RepID=A0A0K1Q795_9BACT|nr:hypothetical protein AKJ09_08195 [Labilithrix luteola]
MDELFEALRAEPRPAWDEEPVSIAGPFGDLPEASGRRLSPKPTTLPA